MKIYSELSECQGAVQQRTGQPINHKRIYRLYGEEGLALKRKRPQRRRSAVGGRGRRQIQSPNQRRAMDFMHDRLADGRLLRVLTVIDVFTRQALAVEARQSFRGHDVIEALSRLRVGHGLPETIRCDQGTEFTSTATSHWAYWNQVRLDFSRPGKPGDNAINEAFNGSVGRECLSQRYSLTINDVGATLEKWRTDYNNERPHSSLDQIPPARFPADRTSTRTRMGC
jgi:putative transposase